MVLVIDNYDSFTYNLVQYLGELGATLDVRRNDTLTLADVEQMPIDRIVISPDASRFWGSALGTRRSAWPSAARWSLRPHCCTARPRPSNMTERGSSPG